MATDRFRTYASRAARPFRGLADRHHHEAMLMDPRAALDHSVANDRARDRGEQGCRFCTPQV